MVHQGCVKGFVFPVTQKAVPAKKRRVCEICGKELGYRKKKFCSSACAEIHKGREQAMSRKTDGTCRVCGRALPNCKRLYCSEECAKHARIERARRSREVMRDA